MIDKGEEPELDDARPPEIVNDFTLNIATINGSGSQTSNSVLLRSLFKMGIPVTGKNFFPSNIHGLPTWYEIRLSRDGYMAHTDDYQIVVCMNGRSMATDLAGLAPGGVAVYDDSLSVAVPREDVFYYPVPVAQLIRDASLPPDLRDYIANMVYVGVLAQLLGIDLEEIRAALEWTFEGKAKPAKLNMDMVQCAYEWAQASLVKRDPFRARRMAGSNEGKLLVDGNAAGALGAIWGGVTLVAWYPITPASSLPEALTKYLPLLREDPDNGKATFAIIQAEDELAALGMVIGAGWMGARALTSTSGPGLSLMAEFAGLAYFAEVPAVIWDVQRIGPSTGLPTRTSQGDIQFAYTLSHGDTRHVMLLPSSPAECFEFGVMAFDLADRLQTLVLVMSDLDLGMNSWVSSPFVYPEQPMDRGKVLTAADLERLKGQWSRYQDVDGDGITYRTLPGTPHPQAAYFTRGTGHNERAQYTERADEWERNMDRLQRKFDTARGLVPRPHIDERPGSQVAIISYGSNDPAVEEARVLLRAGGLESSYLRLRALPINATVREFLQRHQRVCVVENNHDGQMYNILVTEQPDCAARMVPVHHSNGFPLSAQWIAAAIRRG